MPPIVTRFAPSPTGPLHLGHARAAFFAHDLARRLGGRFLLRIEDLDAARCRPEWEEAIGRDLAWLGLRVDGPVRRQSRHMGAYRAATDAFRTRGLVYPCFCTRAAIAREIAASAGAPHDPAPHDPAPHDPAPCNPAPFDPDGAPLYPGTCRALGAAERAARIAQGEPHAWRLDMAAAIGRPLHRHGLDGQVTECRPERFGDVVLGRRDVPASYHLCATHDDAACSVTLVTRGTDLEPAADLHRLLQSLMGWPAPLYRFHPLLCGADGRRLSKRDGAASLRSLREAGLPPAEIRRLTGVDALLDQAMDAARTPGGRPQIGFP